MCGITGFSGFFQEELLKRMSNAISHRGPDDEGIFYNKKINIGLAHRRLSIVDLSETGHQPMYDQSNNFLIVYNGEIYNFQILKEELKLKGYKFRGSSDTEVLLNMYLEYGYKMLDRINGIFAFCILDNRKNELFIARDHLGIKPLYYTKTNKGFIFSSEIKSLLQEESVSRELDYRSIFNHVTFLWSPGSETLLNNVKKLEPGHALIIANHKIQKKWCYYNIPYLNKRTFNKSKENIISDVKSSLINSVNSQLVSDVPIGAFLSGGLDSSSVVALAKNSNPDLDINCFTIKMNSRESGIDGFSEDLPYAMKVADHLGVKLNVVEVDSNMIMDLPNMIYHLDEPQADPAPLNVSIISELAKNQGIKVLLSGTGGDDFFTGYRRHYALILEKYWAFLPTGIKGILSNSGSFFKSNSAIKRRFVKAFEYAHLNENKRIASYFSWIDPYIGIKLFNKDVQQNLNGYNPIEYLSNTISDLPQNCSKLDKMLYIEAKHFLADHNLNYTDKMGMSKGVEIRVPLIDIDLIEKIVNIPDNLKQKGYIGKWIFKKIMEDYLPKDVIYRPKTGFGAPLRYWMKNQLKPIISEYLSKESLSKFGIFDAKEVNKLIKLDSKGYKDYSYTIYSILCIEIWMRTFVEKSTPQIISI